MIDPAQVVNNPPLFSLTVDLGQLLLGILISTLTWFVKREITNLNNRLDKHEEVIFDLAGKLQKLIGESIAWNGTLRRIGDPEK